jgi:hypothetical protein
MPQVHDFYSVAASVFAQTSQAQEYSVANASAPLTCSRLLRLRLVKRLSTRDYGFADFLLALIYCDLHLQPSLPNLFIGCIYAV